MKQRELVITIDGPAGVGKSSVCKEVADQLSYLYLDTGALYRAVAWKVKETGTSVSDEAALKALCETIDLSYKRTDDGAQIVVDGKDVTDEIRAEEIGSLASVISAVPKVREALLPLQRKTGERGGIVAEGRDMGTVVFPEAEKKFFLTADVAERAKRRYLQLSEKGVESCYDNIIHQIEVRDRQDSLRNIAPLKPAEDAVIIDTTAISKTEVVAKMLHIIRGNGEKAKTAGSGLLA